MLVRGKRNAKSKTVCFLSQSALTYLRAKFDTVLSLSSDSPGLRGTIFSLPIPEAFDWFAGFQPTGTIRIDRNYA